MLRRLVASLRAIRKRTRPDNYPRAADADRPPHHAPDATRITPCRGQLHHWYALNRVRQGSATFLSRARQDVRSARRRLWREPTLAAAAVVTVGLAVGLATAIYSVASAVLLRPLPYDDPDRLVAIWRTMPDVDFVPLPVPEFLDLQSQAFLFDDIAGLDKNGYTLLASTVPQWADGLRVTPNLFDLLRLRPILGRTFLPDENQRGRDKVVVLAEGFWRRVFGGDQGIVGTHIHLIDNGARSTQAVTYEVIGVVPSTVRLSYRYPLRADIFVPRVFTDDERSAKSRRRPGLIAFGRLRPGVPVGQAGSDVRALIASMELKHPGISLPGGSARVVSLHEELLGQTRPAFMLLGMAALIVLLIACANVANLLLADGARRAREVGIRVALGCSRPYLLQQLLIEYSLLALAAGVFGLFLAVSATPLLGRFTPITLPRADQISFDSDLLAFAFLVSCLAGSAFSTAPAWMLSRSRVTVALKGGFGATESETRRFRGSFVVAETALLVVLLTGTGLVTASLWRLISLDLGFNPAGVITLRMTLPDRLADNEQRLLFERDLLTRVRRLPAVVNAATSDHLPFDTGSLADVEFAEGASPHPSLVSVIDTEFIRLLEVPLRAGRLFTPGDFGNANVAIINESLARSLPKETVLGQRILVARQWREVVGVVGDITEVGQVRGEYIRQAGLERVTLPAVYLPSGTAWAPFDLYLLVRTPRDVSEILTIIRQQMAQIDPDVAPREAGTLEARVTQTSENTRFQAFVIGLFAVAATVLGAVGLWGVLAQAVNQRRREIAIRLAVGASRGRVRWLVTRQASASVTFGVALGVSAVFTGGSTARSVLFDVAPTDPWILGAVVTLVLLVATVVAYCTAREATRVDPASVLRSE